MHVQQIIVHVQADHNRGKSSNLQLAGGPGGRRGPRAAEDEKRRREVRDEPSCDDLGVRVCIMLYVCLYSKT